MPALKMFRLILTSALLLAASGCAITSVAPPEPHAEEHASPAAVAPEPPEHWATTWSRQNGCAIPGSAPTPPISRSS